MHGGAPEHVRAVDELRAHRNYRHFFWDDERKPAPERPVFFLGAPHTNTGGHVCRGRHCAELRAARTLPNDEGITARVNVRSW